VLEIYLVSEVYGPGNEIIRNVIGRSYAQGFNFGGFQIGLGPENWVNQKQAGRIALLVEKNQQALKGIGEETAKQIRQSIAEGVLKGESIPKIQERIIERSEAIGVTRATMLARTEAMTAANTAAVDRYRAAGVDVLEWIAADDERTCTDTFEAQGYTYEGGCIGMDGRTFPIGQAPWCPGHPNCRCTLAPKVD
jgi:SPP1 gp7 family putative phage head morphogenesis protein